MDPLAPIYRENGSGYSSFAGQGWNLRTVAAYKNFLLQTQMMEADILALIERDPEGAAKSWIGRAHLMGKFGFLRPDPNADCSARVCERVGEDYPRKFELKDVLLDGKEITLQLIAEEYFEDAGELTPYTLEAAARAAYRTSLFVDPFATAERPDVTVEHVGEDGRTLEIVNLANKDPQKRPEYGFRDYDPDSTTFRPFSQP